MQREHLADLHAEGWHESAVKSGNPVPDCPACNATIPHEHELSTLDYGVLKLGSMVTVKGCQCGHHTVIIHIDGREYDGRYD